jgi:outer membrane lipoprotein-sorting protein
MISTRTARTRAIALLAAGAAAGATLLAPVAASAAPATTTATTATAAFSDVLKPGQSLKAGQKIRSKNGVYTLVMQSDGNAVLIKGRTALWSTATNRKGSVLVMQKDGNLVVVSGRTKVWASNTNGSTNSTLAVQNDNNLVIYNSRGKAVWYKNMVIETLGVSRVLQQTQFLTSRNRVYRLNMQADGNLTLTKNGKTVLWHTGTGKNPGSLAVMQSDGNFVVYSAKKVALWHSKTVRKGAVLVLQDSGNLVIVYGRTVVWQTKTAGR